LILLPIFGFVNEEKKKPSYYFLAWAFAAAFLIRAILLQQRLRGVEVELTIWNSPPYYYALSGVCFAGGLYLLLKAKKENQ
jgi:hypothetical protein